MKHPLVTLLTDFGTSDHYVAAMKGVMLGICPGLRLVDVSHEVTPYAIPEAAYTLAQAWKCFPKVTVHLVVVDPGVGSDRRPVIAEAGGHFFVAPDNGVLTMVLAAEPKHRVREITARKYFREPVSRTFHGRDVFAPVAAHLACGIAASKFGKRIDDCVRLPFAAPVQTGRNRWTGTVLKVDRFGNIVTSFPADFPGVNDKSLFQIVIGSGTVSRLLATYAEAADQKPFAIAGSSGYLEISCRERDAARVLGVRSGSLVSFRLSQ